ncbi:hypothetical protein WME91_12495 [Sorangium sp. So ce269]
MIKAPDLAHFVRGLSVLRRQAMNVSRELEHLQHFDHPVEEDTLLQRKLEWHVERLYDRTRLAFEVLAAPRTRKKLEAGFRRYKDDLAALGHDENGDLRSSSLEFLGRYVSILEDFFPSEPTSDERSRVELLERILRNTPKILQDRGLKPAKETPVYKAVGDVLGLVFPDFTPKVNLAKPLKTYKPDFGFPELGIAVEYKFASTEQEVKTALDGIFSDMQGYGGSREWTTFYAVIYMTGHFFTQEQIEAHTKISEGRQNWRILPVYGVGTKREPVA